ncbi:hypothetical protein RB595_006691 [Gaeumannomyces hyphopodioides]
MAQLAEPINIFHLVPKNDTAREALRHPFNSRFVSRAPNESLGLGIGFHVASVPGRVMARLGRDADLILQQRNVSGVHVSFEMHPETLVVLLSCRTKRTSSVVVTPTKGSAEQINGDCVLSYGIEYTLAIANYDFVLKWRPGTAEELRELSIREYTEALKRQAQGNVDSRYLPTEADSEVHTWHNTRIHSARRPLFQEAKGVKRVRIGGGQFGKVYQAVDDLTGNRFAVKALLLDKHGDPEDARSRAHREVKALMRLKHKNIVEFLFLDKWETMCPEIFMPLRMGSLKALVKTRDMAEMPDNKLSLLVLEQMLSALDCLADNNVCHRDVKPDNIIYFWVQRDSKDPLNDKAYTFQLADFGLTNAGQLARTRCGTPYYMAPEVHYGERAQTPKVDVWSLFATIAEIHSSFTFPPAGALVYEGVLAAIRTAALVEPGLAPMVRENPDHRASAAQMLTTFFGGRGLTTPLNGMPPIPDAQPSQPAAPAPRARAPAPMQNPPVLPLVKYPRLPRRPPRDAPRAAAAGPLGNVGVTKPSQRAFPARPQKQEVLFRVGRDDAAPQRFLAAPRQPPQLQRPPLLSGGVTKPVPAPNHTIPEPARVPALEKSQPGSGWAHLTLSPTQLSLSGPSGARMPGSFPD